MADSRVIVHFGMHKTGTSSIQASLHAFLPDPAFHFVSLAGANQSVPVQTLFMKQPELSPMHRKHGVNGGRLTRLQTRYADRWAQQFGAAAGRTAILSGESISALDPDALRNLHQALGAYAADVRAVGYVRSPKSYMESAFQQRVKAGLNRFRPASLVPRYERVLALDAVFGAERVDLWKFAPAEFMGGDVVLDFCARLGIAYPPDRTIRVNESLSLPALRLLYCFRKFGPAVGAGPTGVSDATALIRRVTTLPGRKLRFAADLVRPLLEQQATLIARMEQRLGTSLAEDLENDDASAIRQEGDLLRIDDQAGQWLASQLGPEFERRWERNLSPERIAEWMCLLRDRVRDVPTDSPPRPTEPRSGRIKTHLRRRAGSKETEMADKTILKPKDIMARIQAESPEVLEGLAPAKATRLIRAVLKGVAAELEAAGEGSISVAGLGRFLVRQVEKEKNGTKTTVKQLKFRPSSRAAGKD